MKEGWPGVGAWVLVQLATGILCDRRQVLLSRHSFMRPEVVGPGCGGFCGGREIEWPGLMCWPWSGDYLFHG